MARETYIFDTAACEVVTKEEYQRRQAKRGETKCSTPVQIRKVVRGRWVYDRAKQQLVSADEYVRRAPQIHVISDLKPYKGMMDGKMVDGRRQHRDYLKRHGVVEVGNEKNFAGQKPQLDHPGHDVKRVVESYGL